LQGIADAVGRGCIDGSEMGKLTVLCFPLWQITFAPLCSLHFSFLGKAYNAEKLMKMNLLILLALTLHSLSSAKANQKVLSFVHFIFLQIQLLCPTQNFN